MEETYDVEEVFERLREEAERANKKLIEIESVLNSHGKFEGCTAVGGVKHLLEEYIRKDNEVFDLKRKLEKENK